MFSDLQCKRDYAHSPEKLALTDGLRGMPELLVDIE